MNGRAVGSAIDSLTALRAVRLSWAPTPDDVWRSQSDVHVPGLHERVFDEVIRAYVDAQNSYDASPLGVVVTGPAGSGKTHLLGQVREEVQQRGGYFFLIRLLDASDFWRSALMGILDDLSRPSGHGEDSQVGLMLRRLCAIAGVDERVRRAVLGEDLIDRSTLDEFVAAHYRIHPRNRRTGQHILRALILSVSPDMGAQDLGDAYLQCIDDVDAREFDQWGIRRADLGYQGIAENISRLLAVTGPTVLAIDQVDTLVAQARTRTDHYAADEHEDKVVENLAHGLMTLRETLPRTVSVLSALTSAWELISARGVAPMRDRFRVTETLRPIPSSEVGRLLLGRRLGSCFREVGFVPPRQTWPIAESAFDLAPDFTPRQLLIAVDKHIRRCLDVGEALELTSFADATATSGPDVSAGITAAEIAALDARYAALMATADVSTTITGATEDTLMPPLLSAGLTAWIHEHQGTDDSLAQDPPPSAKAALHARLRHTVDTATDDEEHWCFRAVTSDNARAALSRIEKARTAAGLHINMPRRRLILIRNIPWSPGAKTMETVAALRRQGLIEIALTEADRRQLAALAALLDENSPHLTSWLLARKPAHDIALFRATLPREAAGDSGPPAGASSSGASSSGASSSGGSDVSHRPVEAPRRRPAIVVGTEPSTGAEVLIELESLRKHTAIFAGSGSGKTVLIRRLVEECALAGVSSIVLDVNNDLARLGTAWPTDERSWAPGDEAKAAAYLAHTDVVVWTPRKASGRPLAFRPLPDFASVIDDADEFDASVESAVAALGPAAMVTGSAQKARHGLAVLRETLVNFGHRGGGTLADFIALLEYLPEDTSQMKDAVRIASGLAENLKASTANDPLFGGAGTPIDPGVLLTPAEGKRARVSVINLAGLTTDEQKQSFVNQLQMGLFAWIKRNPAGDRPLGGLLVMDEAQNFAPSDRATAATHSTLALASQARKYGLGLIFATQAPKGLHNRIAGNAATQFYGLLNSPAQIEAAKEMARVKGGAVPDVGRLPAGQFYAAVEGSEFRRAATPLCLTHHPKSPPTEEEVLAIARGKC